MPYREIAPARHPRTADPNRLTERIVGALERYLSSAGAPPPAQLRGDLQALIRGVIEGTVEGPGPEDTLEVTVLVSDIRGFTGIAEVLPLERVVGMLNRYLSAMCDVICRHGGTVDKFMGDSIMVLFGAPVERPAPVESAIACAIEMQAAMADVNRENERLGLPALYQGIGINTGQVMAGRLGSEFHSEYTVIGNEVNVASRIEACSLRGQILISQNSLSRVRPGLCGVSAPILVSVKGKRNPVSLYEVFSIGSPWDLKAPEREARRSQRASVDIPFRFQVCEGKVVVDPHYEGRIGNLSIGGMQASTRADVQPHLNLKFRLAHNVLGRAFDDIYGRILTVRKEGQEQIIHVEFVSIAPEDRQAIDCLVKSGSCDSPPSSLC